jgi:hypothetical protein
MPALTAHPITDSDHHFVLPNGVVITIPFKDCPNMANAADRVNAMMKTLDIGHKNGSPQYLWAAIGFEGKCYFICELYADTVPCYTF